MSFIELPGIQDVNEPKIVPEGRYDLRIAEVPNMRHNDKTGKNNLLVVIEIEGEPDAANILHNLSMIGQEDTDDQKQFKLLMIKRFCHAFGIDISGGNLNTEDFAGQRASGINVSVDEYEGTKKNVLKLPALPQEEE